jgi:antitoxin component YwqK of YwqJK toxin-antitoxin module
MARFYIKDRLWAYGSPATDGSVSDTVRVKEGLDSLLTRFANGDSARSMRYRNGELDGEFREYHANGQLMESTMYLAGLETGPTREYHANGQLMILEPHVDGVIHGERVVYWDNGKVRERTQYLQGTQHGTRMLFDRTGKRIVTYHMRNDGIVRIEH